MTRLSILALMVLSACSSPVGHIVVRDDNGGQIDRYERKRERLADADRVILCGRIHSAATIYVSLPNACSCSGAQFSFHGSRSNIHYSPEGTAVMASYYPEPLRGWFMREAAHLYWPQDYRTLSARQLHQMGVLPICGG